MTIAIISMIRDAWGGSEELWYEMAKEALKRGHKVIHLGFEHPQKHPKTEELENLGLIRLTRPGWIPDTSPTKRFVYLSLNYIRKKIKDPFATLFSLKLDVVLYNGTCYSIAHERGLLKHIYQNKLAKFYILGHLNHDLLRDISNQQATIIKQAYTLSKTVFFVSQRSLETAQRHLCTTIHNAAIVRNPVNISSIEAISFPDTTGTINLAMVGNLVTIHKGQDILLEALSKWEESNWQLNIYGKGYDQPYLEQLVTFLGLQNKVTFHGTTHDIRQVWKGNHMLLMPSHMEGMPLAVVEAMLCGRVCLATDIGGHKEWIEDGVNGFIAPAATVNALQITLQRAWALKNHWATMGTAAHETALNLYDPNAGATLLNRIIAE